MRSSRPLLLARPGDNNLLTTLSNTASNINITDVEAGFKLFRREALEKINIRENRFGFEPEITAKASKRKVWI
jgi:hypothetical protein